jgi:hypothetical protein
MMASSLIPSASPRRYAPRISRASAIISSITAAVSIARLRYFVSACSSIAPNDRACTTFFRCRVLT